MSAPMPAERWRIYKAQKYSPAISIFLPFEPKMYSKPELLYSLKTAAAGVEKELKEKYPTDTTMQIMEMIGSAIDGLNFSTHKKSVAIYVTPEYQKVLYLDIPVETKTIIGESFDIRDLVKSKKNVLRYLVLVISARESKLYRGNAGRLVQLVAAGSGSLQHAPNDVRHEINGVPKPSQKGIPVRRFLKYVDDSLHIVMNAWHFPLFVLGPEKVLTQFKNISKHVSSVHEYINGDFDNASPSQLAALLEDFLYEGEAFRQKRLLNLLEKAAGTKKLATGIRDVWREALNAKGKLLLVEKNYMYAALPGNKMVSPGISVQAGNKLRLSKDAVDDVIERVLENGGDVEFVDKNLLRDYDHIALVQFY